MFQLIEQLVPERRACWDVGTGNGQLAGKLADLFDHVYATDISARQLLHAVQTDNIRYSVQPAERTNFPDGIFDLVTVAQAIHWFDFARFYEEVRRTCRPRAILLVTGYGLATAGKDLDAIVYRLYEGIVGPYWDPERRYILEEYRTIPFPFDEITVPDLSIECRWTLEQMLGYLRTWSAVRHYHEHHGHDPVQRIEADLRAAWPATTHCRVTFPLLMRAGRVGP